MTQNGKIEQSPANLFSQSNDSLLFPLPQSRTGGAASVASRHDDVARALLDKTSLEQDRKDAQYDTKINHRSLLLVPTYSGNDYRVTKADFRLHRLESKRKPRSFTAKERKQLGYRNIPKDAHKWSLYEPLHTLWTGYIKEIVKGGGSEAKLLKADYHGALVKVIRSSCPSILFLTGIVIKETRHTFIICTVDDKLKTIPKKCTVFEFEVKLNQESNAEVAQLMRWEVYGEHFGFRAAERVGKKFKGKHTIDF